MNVYTSPNLIIEPLKENFGQILKEGTDSLKMPYWISAGTALGLYRDKDYIKGDTDIDVEVMGYVGIGLDIVTNMKGFELVRSVITDGRPMQLAFQKDRTIFDIYIYWDEGDDVVNRNDMCTLRLPKKFLKTETIETKYGKYPFPSPIEEYLVYRYGDWLTPKQDKGIYGSNNLRNV